MSKLRPLLGALSIGLMLATVPPASGDPIGDLLEPWCELKLPCPWPADWIYGCAVDGCYHSFTVMRTEVKFWLSLP